MRRHNLDLRRIHSGRGLFGSLLIAAVAIMGACEVSTANLSSLTTGVDKDITRETTAFKAGDTIYANATVSNNPGKVTVKMYITVDDAPGMTKGATIPNSEVSMPVEKDGTVKYSYPTFPTTKGGKFNIVADMLNDAGEKKDGKTQSITVDPGTAPATANQSPDSSTEDE